MAENKEGQEKTEDPTSRRLEEARNRGQVGKSTDVTTAGMLILGGLLLFAWGNQIMTTYRGLMINIFHNVASYEITYTNIISSFYKFILLLASLLLPLMLMIYVVALIGEISQVGFKIANKKFTEGLNFKKIFNPFEGIRKLFFSTNSLVELVKSFIKLFLLGGLAIYIIINHTEELITLAERPFFDFATVMVDLSFELVWKIGLLFLFIAAFDYFYQKWRFKTEMKMTKQEVKDEVRQSEGDQMVKARIRSIMRNRLRKLMLSKVPKADVVITNPTHFAVALRYKPGEDHAPRVVAKGVDFLALKIKTIALENNVPVVEEPPLARQLYFTCEIDQEIPEKLFKAVAQVLAYIYHLKQKSPF
jgi:flagellar biosynthetic protein FlhB